MEAWISPALANGIGVVGVVFFVGVLVYRSHLVPGPIHRAALRTAELSVEKAEARADRWEAVALKALHATERLTEPVEVTAKVLTKLPTPYQDDKAES